MSKNEWNAFALCWLLFVAVVVFFFLPPVAATNANDWVQCTVTRTVHKRMQQQQQQQQMNRSERRMACRRRNWGYPSSSSFFLPIPIPETTCRPTATRVIQPTSSCCCGLNFYLLLFSNVKRYPINHPRWTGINWILPFAIPHRHTQRRIFSTL